MHKISSSTSKGKIHNQAPQANSTNNHHGRYSPKTKVGRPSKRAEYKCFSLSMHFRTEPHSLLSEFQPCLFLLGLHLLHTASWFPWTTSQTGAPVIPPSHCGSKTLGSTWLLWPAPSPFSGLIFCLLSLVHSLSLTLASCSSNTAATFLLRGLCPIYSNSLIGLSPVIHVAGTLTFYIFH